MNIRTTRRIEVRTLFAGVALLLASLAAPALSAATYMTPGFKLGETRPRVLVLLPPHADCLKAKAVMTDQMIEEALALEDSGASSIVRMLEAMGYRVRRLTPDEVNHDAEIRELVSRINERYAEEWPKVLRRPRNVKQGRYSLGDDVIKLAERLEVDGIALARIQAVFVSGGRKALTFLLSGLGAYPRSYARVDLAAVDGETGGIESYSWGFEPCKSKALTQRPEAVMDQAFANCLRRYPAEGEILKVKPKELEAMEAEDEDEEDLDQDAVLSELEALLGEDTETGGDDEPEP